MSNMPHTPARWGLLTSLARKAKGRTPRVLPVFSDTNQQINSFKQRIIKLKTCITTPVYTSIFITLKFSSLVFFEHTTFFHVFNPLYMELLCHLEAHSFLQSAITFFQASRKVHELGYRRPWSKSCQTPSSYQAFPFSSRQQITPSSVPSSYSVYSSFKVLTTCYCDLLALHT